MALVFDLVIFDCDGVLVDSEPISNRVLAAAVTDLGLPMTAGESMAIFMGRRWDDSLARIEERLGRPVPADFTESYRAARDRALAAELEAVPGVAEAIARIPAERCVASSGAIEKTRFTLGHTGLLHLFEGRIFSGDEVEHGKPAPDLFLHAAESLGAQPARCAVIEDTLVGIAAARAAGMTAFGYCGHHDAEPVAAAGAHPFAEMAALPGLLGYAA